MTATIQYGRTFCIDCLTGRHRRCAGDVGVAPCDCKCNERLSQNGSDSPGGHPMMWFLSGAYAYAATLVGIVGLCRAAKEGDRQLHAQLPPLDELERLYAEPDRYCPACGGWLAGDDLFDSAECQAAWMEDA